MRDTAYFIKFPSRIENLWRPHLYEERHPYKPAAKVIIDKIDYENFITDLRVEREYLEDKASLCSVDRDGVWYCILVQQQEGSDGVLVIADAGGYVIWAAYLHEVNL